MPVASVHGLARARGGRRARCDCAVRGLAHPRRQARRWAERGIAGKDLVALETGARGALIQLLGGVALILTFVATWLQISDTSKTSERTLDLTSSQQVSQRFTEAVAQLGSKRAEIRIGGIYGLESVAAESPSRRTAITQVLMSYLSRRHPYKGSGDFDAGPQAHSFTRLQFCDLAQRGG